MCRSYSEETQLTNVDPSSVEIDVAEEPSTNIQLLERAVLIEYMKSLSVGKTGSCITPILGKKVIGFANYLKTGTAVADEDADLLVHKWFEVETNVQVIVPFNQRTKTIDEIVELLERDCDLKKVFKD